LRIVAFGCDAYALAVLDGDGKRLAAGALDKLKQSESPATPAMPESEKDSQAVASCPRKARRALVELCDLQVNLEGAALKTCAHAQRDAGIDFGNEGLSFLDHLGQGEERRGEVLGVDRAVGDRLAVVDDAEVRVLVRHPRLPPPKSRCRRLCGFFRLGSLLQLIALDEGIDHLQDLAPLGRIEPLELLEPPLHTRVHGLGLALGGFGAEQRFH
jgi:hypothetical protein